MKIQVCSAQFTAGAVTAAQLPAGGAPEVAVIGRSNVGKSTLINRLTGRRNLARTSATPGRTRELNFFEVQIRSDRGQTKQLTLVDLPGFGFAKNAPGDGVDLSELINGYLCQRENLRVICLLNDARREPLREELAVQAVTFDYDRHLIVIATKLDKLNQAQKSGNLKKLAMGYRLEVPDLVLAGEGLAADAVWARIWELV